MFIGIDIVSAIAASLWLLSYDVINIDFINALIKLETGNSIAFKIFSNFQPFCLLCILFALLLDSVYVLIKLKRD